MNLKQTVDLFFGGPGSGCDPDVARANGTECGRPPKSDDYEGYVLPTDEWNSLADEVEEWKYDKNTPVGRNAEVMQEGLIDVLHLKDEGFDVMTWNTGKETLAAMTFTTKREGGLLGLLGKKNYVRILEVVGLLANPKYLGSEHMKGVLRSIREFAKEENFERIDFHRLKVTKENKNKISKQHSIPIAAAMDLGWYLGL